MAEVTTAWYTVLNNSCRPFAYLPNSSSTSCKGKDLRGFLQYVMGFDNPSSRLSQL